jgi:hypothetical protein
VTGLNDTAPSLVLGEELDIWIDQTRKALEQTRPVLPARTGDERLDAFVNSARQKYLPDASVALDATASNEARRFADSFLARLEHFNNFARHVYGRQDTLLREELVDVVRKTFAATAGSALAFYCLDHAGEDDPASGRAAALREELAAGI